MTEYEENQQINAEISKIRQNLAARQKNELDVAATIAEMRLRGYYGNYVVKRDSNGIITNIVFSNEKIDTSCFKEEYNRFVDYQNDHGIQLIRDKKSFEELDPTIQAQMVYWKMGYSL